MTQEERSLIKIECDKKAKEFESKYGSVIFLKISLSALCFELDKVGAIDIDEFRKEFMGQIKEYEKKIKN